MNKVQITERIPIDKMEHFHSILCNTGGRYLRNPFILWETVEVCYEPGDYDAHLYAWDRYISPIKETRRDQWWCVLFRRLTHTFN